MDGWRRVEKPVKELLQQSKWEMMWACTVAVEGERDRSIWLDSDAVTEIGDGRRNMSGEELSSGQVGTEV